MANYTGMMMGSITLCLVADAIGRLKTLFACLLIAFIGGLSSAFAFDSLRPRPHEDDCKRKR